MNITKYEVIRQYVIDQIYRHLHHDRPIMSERGMCRKFGVTRTTVRKALHPLVEAGTLIPRRGAGFYVNHREYANSMSRFPKVYKIAFLSGNGHVGFWGLFLRRLIGRVGGSFPQDNVELIFNCLTGEPGMEREEIMMYHPDAVIWFRPSVRVRPVIEALRRELPVCVLLDDGTDRGFSVTLDYCGAGSLAARWFLDQGCRRAALLGTEPDGPDDSILQQYQRGWRKAWEEGTGGCDRNLLVPQTAAFSSFLESEASRDVDGFFCHASSFPGFAQDWGDRPADRLPVMTDSSFFSLPGQTGLLPGFIQEFCSRKLFRFAADRLLKVIDGKAAPERILFRPEIVRFRWD